MSGCGQSWTEVMRGRILLSGLVFGMMAGCGSSTAMKFYPTSGPLSEQSPPPVIAAKASFDTENSGRLKLKLPDGAKCEGTWTSVAPKVQSRERGLSLTIRNFGGKIGRSTETVGGVNHGEVYAVCKDGTILQGTFAIGSGTSSGTGTAVDTRGNAYKLLF